MEADFSSEVESIRSGGIDAATSMFVDSREKLRRMIEFRLDSRLRGRIEPADVLQDAWVNISSRLDEYLASPDVPFFIWMRQLTYQQLIDNQRQHFGKKRSPLLERRLSESSSSVNVVLNATLRDPGTSPSNAAMRVEDFRGLRNAIRRMDDIDREILMLRHFEQLSNVEVAQILELSTTAASNRYIRAMERLRRILVAVNKHED